MTFSEALLEAINYWNGGPIEDEWFFENFRNEYIGRMSSEEAFLAISESLHLLVNEKNESTVCEILQTIINLANKSQTTEIPSELLDKKALLEERFQLCGEYAKAKLNELFSYYRIK